MSATLLQSTAPMPATNSASRSVWVGRILSGIAVLFLTLDVVMKFIPNEASRKGTLELGYQPHHIPIIGAIGLVCLVLYVIPRTAPLGAILWTGYFGGAIATHLRLDNPLFSHILFPVYIAALLWGGLYLRDARVRGLVRAR